tara:strand:+ start:78 stop:1340 length:1263 start_codon:yes stop_codon:yes gene_type:complete
VKLFFLVNLLKITFDIAYSFYVVPTWEYLGFISNLSFPYYILILLTTPLPFLINNKSNHPSNFFISILLLGILLPLSTLAVFGAIPIIWYFYNLIFFILITSIDRLIADYHFKDLSIQFLSFHHTLFFLLITIFLLYIASYGLSINMDLLSFDGLLIYGIRDSFNASSIQGIRGYIFENFSSVILPASVAYAVLFNRYLMLICSFFIVIVIFSTDAMKGTLLAPVLSGIIIFLFKRKVIVNQFDLLKVSFLSSSILLMVLSLMDNTLFISAIVYYRTIFLPSMISSFYFDFFQFNDFTYFSDTGIISFFTGDSYPVNIKKMVASVYLYKNPATNMNVGLIGDGFLKIGLPGIFVTAIVLSIFLKLINQFGKNKNTILIKAMLLYPFYSLINGSLYTVILTNGLFLSVILVIFLENNDNQK